MTDKIETIGNSLVQHGQVNDRVYLMKLHPDDLPQLPSRLEELAAASGYGKIFAKIPSSAALRFMRAGYRLEAEMPGFYDQKSSAYFVAKYPDPSRGEERKPGLREEVLAAAVERQAVLTEPELPDGCQWRKACEEDADEMARLFRRVFASYPFPIHDPDYLRSSMEGSTVYFLVRQQGQLIAISSAEIDLDSQSVEMTDFATLPERRGLGLALFLLRRMEAQMAARGIRSFFTIARAYSFGMNITFARNGYSFGGTLPNNTNISGSLESMNVWYKIV